MRTILRTVCSLALISGLVFGQFEEESTGGLYSLHPHSLSPPFVDKLEMTWFDYGGDTVIDTYSHIRLTPDSPSRSGYVWSKKTLPKHNWQVEVEFKVDGTSSHISGDGLAIWASQERNRMGPVFGNVDYFNGLGLFFDTYNNGAHDESFPYVYAMLGDGKTHYNNDQDGFPTKAGGCSSDFKHNFHKTKALITYVRGQYLEVKLQTKEEEKWEDCFSVTNFTLPNDVYLGFTAHTGQLHDYHDIVNVVTRTANTPPPLTSKSGYVKTTSGGAFWNFFVLLFKLCLLIGVFAILFYGYQAHQAKNNKRF